MTDSLIEGLRSIDLPAGDEISTECFDCTRWRFQIVIDGDCIIVREWHEPGCSIFDDLGEDE